MAKGTIIYLFRNDLRLHDNECLTWGIRQADYLIPLYCFDPDHYKATWHFKFPKTGCHRAQFLLECVKDLRQSLRKYGTNLVIRNSRPVDAIQDLIEKCKEVAPVSAIVLQKEVTKEEVDVEDSICKLCETLGVEIKMFWGWTLYHIDDIPFNCGGVPSTFSTFRKGVESQSHIRNLLDFPAKFKKLPPLPNGKLGDMPSITQLTGAEMPPKDSRSAFPFEGGESTGLSRLHNYLWTSNNVARYKETRNGLLGTEYSTKFSPWLASGSLSPRKIYYEVKKFEKERKCNESTNHVVFELIWRDFFRFVGWRFGDKIFYPGGMIGKRMDWKKDMKLFEKWRLGQTGVPFVDANMRELLHTGFMSNRGRQNVASFLVKDMNLDWRLGAEWFESMLLDHDVCSNYGNWNFSAGIGSDSQIDRKFNIIKQALDYDHDGDYIYTWIPELCNVQKEKVHMPWTLSLDIASKDYPQPIAVASEWAKHYPKARIGYNTPIKPRGIDYYFK